jgi:hypothetical protein
LIFKQGLSDIKAETNFSDKMWGSQTRDYAYLAKDKLHGKSKCFIFHTAKHYSKDMMPYHDKDKSATANSEAEPIGCCAMLVDLL